MMGLVLCFVWGFAVGQVTVSYGKRAGWSFKKVVLVSLPISMIGGAVISEVLK